MTVLKMGSNSPNAHLGKGLGDKEGKEFWGGKKKKSNCLSILLWCPFTSVHIKVGVFFLPLSQFIFYFLTVPKWENYC